MPNEPHQRFGPGFKIEAADAERTATGATCFTRADGVHFCPANMGVYGLWGEYHVLLTMEIGRNGLFIAWTPEGARETAQLLLDMAAKAEANLAATAAAELDGITKGKPA